MKTRNRRQLLADLRATQWRNPALESLAALPIEWRSAIWRDARRQAVKSRREAWL